MEGGSAAAAAAVMKMFEPRTQHRRPAASRGSSHARSGERKSRRKPLRCHLCVRAADVRLRVDSL